MTPTEAAIRAEMDRATVDGVVRVSVALMNELRARSGRYEKALNQVWAVTLQTGPDRPSAQYMAETAHKIAQEALRCE